MAKSSKPQPRSRPVHNKARARNSKSERRRALNEQILTLINGNTRPDKLLDCLEFTDDAKHRVVPRKNEFTQLRGIKTGDGVDQFVLTIDIYLPVIRSVARKLGLHDCSSWSKGDICQEIVEKWINPNNNAAADANDSDEDEDFEEEGDDEYGYDQNDSEEDDDDEEVDDEEDDDVEVDEEEDDDEEDDDVDEEEEGDDEDDNNHNNGIIINNNNAAANANINIKNAAAAAATDDSGTSTDASSNNNRAIGMRLLTIIVGVGCMFWAMSSLYSSTGIQRNECELHSPPHTPLISPPTTMHVFDNNEEKIQHKAEEITANAKTPTTTNTAALTLVMFILEIILSSSIVFFYFLMKQFIKSEAARIVSEAARRIESEDANGVTIADAAMAAATTTASTVLVSSSNLPRMMHPTTQQINYSITQNYQRLVECQHFHQMTPVGIHMNDDVASIPPNNTNYIDEANYYDEEDKEEMLKEIARHALDQRVLEAGRQLADMSPESTNIWKDRLKLFQACAARPKLKEEKSLKDKDIKTLRAILAKTSPHILVSARSSGRMHVPEGLNVLQAACHVGNDAIVQYLLEHHVDTTPVDVGDVGESGEPDAYGGREEENEEVIPKLDLNAVDTKGWTALHIASFQGHKKVIPLLKRAYAAIHGQQDNDVENQPRQCDDDHDRKMMLFRSQLMPIHTGLPTLSSSLYTKKATTPTFAGPRAPIDLAGHTPLALALISSGIKNEDRAELEKLLYQQGDPSILGHGGRAKRTPARARCGPSTPSPSSKSSLLSPMAAASTARRAGNSSSRTPPINNSSSDLIPTPIHNNGGYLLSPHAPSSIGGRSSRQQHHHQHHHPGSATPRCSTIDEEDLICFDDNNMDYFRDSSNSTTQRMKNGLQWGFSEMNGFRIDMEDVILVKGEMYGEDDAPPPPSTSLLGTDIHTKLASAAATTTSDPISMELFGVFDGHDGKFASNYVATHLYDRLVAQPEWAVAYHNCNLESNTTLLSSIITQACHDIDEKLRNEKTKPSKDCGSTAIMALVCNRYLFVANVGDSRCILVTKKKTRTQTKAATTNAEDDEVAATTVSGSTGSKPCWQSSEIEVIAMSVDHKAHLAVEKARIESAGLTVVQTDNVPSDYDPTTTVTISRVWKSKNKHMGTARAFGDYDFKSNSELSASKQAVICTPDIVVRKRKEDDDMYLILACDGIWDVMSNEAVGKFVAGKVAERLHYSSINTNNTVQEEVLARVGDDLLAECLERRSRDNMSVLIVAFSASGLNSSALSLATMEKESKVADVSSSLFPFE